MTLNEILFITVVVVLLILPSLLTHRIRQPLTTYVNWIIGLLLLIIVWGFNVDGSLPLSIIITAVVIKGAIKTMKEYKGFSTKPELNNE